MESQESYDLSYYIDKYFIIETKETRYIDIRYGTIIPEDQLHIQYRKSHSFNVQVVMDIRYVIQEDNNFYVACLNAYGEEDIDHYIYYPHKNIFVRGKYDPSVIIPYIRKQHPDYFNMNENLTEMNTSCDYFKYTKKIIRQLKPIKDTHKIEGFTSKDNINEGFTSTYDIHKGYEKKYPSSEEGYISINNTKRGMEIEQIDSDEEIIYEHDKVKESSYLEEKIANDALKIVKDLDKELGINDNAMDDSTVQEPDDLTYKKNKLEVNPLQEVKQKENKEAADQKYDFAFIDRLIYEKDKLYNNMLNKKSAQEDVLSRIRLLQATYDKFERDIDDINKHIKQLDCFIASEYYKDQPTFEIPKLEPRPDNIA